jgi:hypothetical protein
VQRIDFGLVSDNIPGFWEANREMTRALSYRVGFRFSGQDSIWPPFEYSDVFCFTCTLSMHMHAQLKGSQGFNYNVKISQFIVQLIYIFPS